MPSLCSSVIGSLSHLIFLSPPSGLRQVSNIFPMIWDTLDKLALPPIVVDDVSGSHRCDGLCIFVWSSLVKVIWMSDYPGSFFSLPLIRCDNFLPIPLFLTAFSTAFASWVFVTDHSGRLNDGWRSLQRRSWITLDGYLHLHLEVSIGVRLRLVYTYISIITTLEWGTVIQKLRQNFILVSHVLYVCCNTPCMYKSRYVVDNQSRSILQSNLAICILFITWS
jgi:hypothetical protein